MSFPKKRCETQLCRGFSFSTQKIVFPAVSGESPNVCSESHGDKPCQRESMTGGKIRSHTKQTVAS